MASICSRPSNYNHILVCFYRYNFNRHLHSPTTGCAGPVSGVKSSKQQDGPQGKDITQQTSRDEEEYLCGTCSRGFKTSRGLKQHQTKMHGKSMNEDKHQHQEKKEGHELEENSEDDEETESDETGEEEQDEHEPVVCPLCQTTNITSLNEHMFKKHKKVMDDVKSRIDSVRKRKQDISESKENLKEVLDCILPNLEHDFIRRNAGSYYDGTRVLYVVLSRRQHGSSC